MSFVGSKSHLHTASVTALICAILCYIGACYNGTRLSCEIGIKIQHFENVICKWSVTFYPAAHKGSGVLSSPGRAGGRVAGQTRPVNTLTSIIFSWIIFKLGKDIYYPKISNEFDHGGSASLNMRINELASFGIPGLIFQAKATKFGTKVGLNMLINISSGFFIIAKNILGKFFFAFCNFAHVSSSYDSDLGPFCSRLQLCTRLPSSYDSDLGPFCSRQLQGLPSSDGYFYVCDICICVSYICLEYVTHTIFGQRIAYYHSPIGVPFTTYPFWNYIESI